MKVDQKQKERLALFRNLKCQKEHLGSIGAITADQKQRFAFLKRELFKLNLEIMRAERH